jgi:hypothetical protein
MNPTSRIDFSYSFATPHRLTVGRPDASERTLLDLKPGSLRMSWSYEDLTTYPLAALKIPPVTWEIVFTAEVDGEPLIQSRWSRVDGILPALDTLFEDPRGALHLQVTGAKTAALARIIVTNTDTLPHRFALRCEKPGKWNGINPGWVNPIQWASDHLIAGWADRADRILILGLGAQGYSLKDDAGVRFAGSPPSANSMIWVWDVPAGESFSGWVVRPYCAYSPDLPSLRTHDWAKEEADAHQEWKELLNRACKISLPDPALIKAFTACLADLFIMREPVAGGSIGTVPGTEGYRSLAPFESAIVTLALDQVGMHNKAFSGYHICWEIQEPDGNWTEPQGWAHWMWGGAGFKAWAGMQHYYTTADRPFLETLYPRLLASSRFQERERAHTRQMDGTDRPLTYGLMPRGMGDCGLMDEDDLYGVFIPHNIWAVYADKLALEAAHILGRKDDMTELNTIYQIALNDLLIAMDRGAITEPEGYRWIPGVPGKTSGSRWGVLNAFYPCHLLPYDHELVVGTLRKIESRISPGGIPVHTGWMKDGMWVAIALDNLAETHLAMANRPGTHGDIAAAYLYAVINHGTPLHTWCEERGQEPGTSECTGDRQHLWTPVAVVRCLRDMLVMEDGGGIHLAIGTDRQWLASGQPVGLQNASTQFGEISYNLCYNPDNSRITGNISLKQHAHVDWIKVHMRLPAGQRISAIRSPFPVDIVLDSESLVWKNPKNELKFEADVVLE